MTCRGQEIALPEGDWQQLYLLAAAVCGDVSGRFEIAGKSTELRIADYRALIGQASHRPAIGRVRYGAPRQAFQRHDRIAWTGTHLHDAQGGNLAYEIVNIFCYSLFAEGVGDSPTASSLRLPKEPRIRLFALALASGVEDQLGAPRALTEL